MKFQTYDIGTWLYPDTELDSCQSEIFLDSARNSEADFQLLTDCKCPKGTKVDWSLQNAEEGISIIVSELRPSLVRYNSGARNHNAIDWDNVKDFAVRRAPYELYDLTRPIDDGALWGDTGYTGFFLRVMVGKEVAHGKKELLLKLNIGEEALEVKIHLSVHKAQNCDAKDSP